MGDILSQNEIDDLLKALNTGEIDVQQMQTTTHEKKIRIHDFRKPSKFAKDHLKTLHIIHENYARLVQTFLSGYLRTLVQSDVIAVEALPYNDFTNSISNPAIMAVIDFRPLTGSIILEMAPSIAFALVDRILGGRGTSIEKIRGFTEIEMAIIERIVIQIMNLMREPWDNVISLRPSFERIENNPQFAQIINPNEMVALVTLNTKVGDVEGLINICIPHMVVEPIVTKLSTRSWFKMIEKETTQETKDLIESKIESTSVPVRAILGNTTIQVYDFLELQMGDVLPLDTSINGDLEILVGNLVKFMAKPGVKRNKVSVKVTQVMRKEGE